MINPEFRKAQERTYDFNQKRLGVEIYLKDINNRAFAEINIAGRGGETVGTTKDRVRFINKAITLASQINNKQLKVYLK